MLLGPKTAENAEVKPDVEVIQLYSTNNVEVQIYAYQKVLEEFGPEEWEAFSLIVMKESHDWQVLTEHYPTGYTVGGVKSSATGLFGFLDSTWGSVGCEKTYDPYKQVDCGIEYIKQRYTYPQLALNFHIANGYY